MVPLLQSTKDLVLSLSGVVHMVRNWERLGRMISSILENESLRFVRSPHTSSLDANESQTPTLAWPRSCQSLSPGFEHNRVKPSSNPDSSSQALVYNFLLQLDPYDYEMIEVVLKVIERADERITSININQV